VALRRYNALIHTRKKLGVRFLRRGLKYKSGMKVATIIDLRNPGKHVCLRFRSCRLGVVGSDAVVVVFQILIVDFALLADIT
jgi:hypothetical protein